jgi:hypothetical protein
VCVLGWIGIAEDETFQFTSLYITQHVEQFFARTCWWDCFNEEGVEITRLEILPNQSNKRIERKFEYVELKTEREREKGRSQL